MWPQGGSGPASRFPRCPRPLILSPLQPPFCSSSSPSPRHRHLPSPRLVLPPFFQQGSFLCFLWALNLDGSHNSSRSSPLFSPSPRYSCTPQEPVPSAQPHVSNTDCQVPALEELKDPGPAESKLPAHVPPAVDKARLKCLPGDQKERLEVRRSTQVLRMGLHGGGW